MTTQYFNITSKTGYSIPCKLFSKGDSFRKVIIGIHGFGGNKESQALSLLAQKMPADYRLIAFDLPAHGQSTPDSSLTLANCISDLLTVCEHVKRCYAGAEIFVFATSFGGFIWLNTESILKDTVSRVVLRVPAVDMGKSLARNLPISFEEFRESGYASWGAAGVTYSFYTELIENDVTALSPVLPTLMICGDKDELVDYSAQLSFAQRNQNTVRMMTLKNAGHRFMGEGELETAVDAAVRFFGEE